MAEMKLLSVLFIAALVICAVPYAYASDPEEHEGFLVDYGNGNTVWYDIVGGDTVGATIGSTLSAAGVAVQFGSDGGREYVESVNGYGEFTVGDGSTPGMQTCSWRVYAWNGVGWEFMTDDVADRYVRGSLALGFYPGDSTIPVSSPENRSVWTSYRGDSSSSGVGDSYGPSKVAEPLEWYNTYSGAVDCNILYADGLIYHTVSGKYGSIGMDSLARLYCIDPVNRETAWYINFSNSGNIEITTPVIVGDTIILTSGNWHVYCIDRFTGDALAELMPEGAKADMCSGSKVTVYETHKDHPSVVSDRVHSEAGVTNCVYDSGALFFCTSDGVARCYSVDRNVGFREIWTAVPENEFRGCSYFYPPTVMDYGTGQKAVLFGNCSGSLTAVDAVNGHRLWSKTYSCGGSRASQVTSVMPCSDDRALVCYSGNGVGGMTLVNVADGTEIWQKDIYCTKPVVFGDRFYGYVSYSAAGLRTVTDAQSGEEISLVSGYYSFWVNDGKCCWSRPTESLCTGGVNYCGGRIYSMDYSPGTEGAYGGWVWCMDADTGNVVWKAKVSPYSGNAYSMCAPTVVDGKVLVGNDLGAIYIISEIPNQARVRSSEIGYRSDGMAHWSWAVLFGTSAAVLFAAIVIYRR